MIDKKPKEPKEHNMTLEFINTAAFIFLGLIWSTSGSLNFSIKAALVFLSLANGVALFNMM